MSTRTLPFSRIQRRILDIFTKNQAGIRSALVGSALLAPVISLAIGLLSLKGGWDDGAITAAFSKTFADTGMIALTPISPPVEGFSSLTWFLLLTLAHLFGAGSSIYLIAMKVFAAFFTFLSLFLFYYLGRRFLRDQNLAAFATWLLAFTITPLYETFNGMEMNLSLFLLLCLVYLLTSDVGYWEKLSLGWLVASLFMATRFEAPYMLLALLIGCLVSRTAALPKYPSVRFMFALTAASFVSFVAMELWRHHTFGVWMPNTVYAKLWWPYQRSHAWREVVTSRISATMEIAVVLFAPLLLALWLIVVNRFAFRNCIARIHPIVLTLAAAAVLFGIVFGKNLGHRGRMIEALLPFLILFLVVSIANASRDNVQMSSALCLVAVLHLGFWSMSAYQLAHRGNGVSIAKLEKEGKASDKVRQLLHRDTLTIMIPDVGGAALCCSKLRILDIALLTNPTLGREGYDNFKSYYTLARPDVVETHEVWAEASRIYEDGLLDDYSLVQASGTRLFVRNDLYSRLLKENAGQLFPIAELPICLGSAAIDRAYSRKKGSCLLINN